MGDVLVKKIFVDTNVLLSGIVFSGSDSELLSLPNIKLYTADKCIEEIKNLAKSDYKNFGFHNSQTMLNLIETALLNIEIIKKEDYSNLLSLSKNLIKKDADSKVLAAAIKINADYLITKDKDFFKKQIKEKIHVMTPEDALKKLF